MGIAMKVELWLVPIMLAYFGVAQYPLDLEGGKIHAVNSTIVCTFSVITTEDPYVMVWRIEEINVCRVVIQGGVVVSQSCNYSPSTTTYYNNNSYVKKATYGADNVLYTEFAYENIQEEAEPIRLSTYDITGVAEKYNETYMTVKSCDSTGIPEGAILTPSSCDFNCVANMSCKEDYSGSSVNATCLANATWNNFAECEGITCNVTCAGCCYDNGTAFAGSESGLRESGVIESGQTLVCCSDVDTTNQSFTCTNGSEIDFDQKCAASTTVPEITTTPETNSQTVPTSNTTQPGGVSGPQLAAIITGCIYLVEVIAVAVITVKFFPLDKKFIGIYAVSSAFAISGIIMAAIGNGPEDFDAVETVGVILGTLGIVGMLIGLVWQCIQGKKSDYSKGSS